MSYGKCSFLKVFLNHLLFILKNRGGKSYLFFMINMFWFLHPLIWILTFLFDSCCPLSPERPLNLITIWLLGPMATRNMALHFHDHSGVIICPVRPSVYWFTGDEILTKGLLYSASLFKSDCKYLDFHNWVSSINPNCQHWCARGLCVT